MIRCGRVSVNEQIITTPGIKADGTRDRIRVDGKLISIEVPHVYIAMNKPRGYVTSLSDPQGRPIVTDLIGGIPDRLFPVGRLDCDSEGLLIMTNDGDFSYRIQHPKFQIPKTYRVKIKGRVSDVDMIAITKGSILYDGYFKPRCVSVEQNNKTSCWLNMTICQGKNRIIRRFFESIDRPVVRLIRVAIGDISLGELPQGAYRYLTPKEVTMLLRCGKK
jgi:pseudouridine synthase